MELFELNSISFLSGIAAVLLVLFIRLHWPFRYQYISSFNKRSEDKMKHWLEASYHKNGTRPVAYLDKSTSEILSGNYELAEKYIAHGLTICKETPTIFNQAIVHYLFYNLSTAYFYCGRYKEALEIAFHVYERDHRLSNALGIIVCAQARMGDVQGAIEAYSMVSNKKLGEELRLFCLAEIDAAKGDFHRAVAHLKKLSTKKNYTSIMHLHATEIEKRIEEWTKASSTQAG
ncbi:tetratricopeptide repeat protein [Brevibacillus sp. SYSU BS000544]|uniref:tetratricopeptide repeat protein n=1 Tax=Brevibacillus sp. SYSU BS000544 TaxID=3416443 RepID=UPI003CE58369